MELKLEPFGVSTTTALEFQASNQFLSNEIAGLGTMAVFLSTIFLSVAATVLNILVNRLTRRQRITVGTLKALGYGDGVIFRHFLWFGVVVGIIGSLLGSGGGFLFSTAMTEVYSWFFQFPRLHSGFYWYTHAVGWSVSLSFALAGSLHGARQMLLLRPAEAMRPAPPRHGRHIWLESLLSTWWRKLSWSWRSVLRGMFRHRLRTATSLFAATMGAGLLVIGFMMTEGQSFLIHFQFFRISRSDVDLVFKQERDEGALDELRRLPGVLRAEPQFNLACTFVNGPYQRKGSVTGIARQAELTVPHDSQFHPIEVPESGVVLTQRLADRLDARVGDRITVVPTRGLRRPISVPVARIADSYLGLAAYADIRYLSQSVGESLVLTSAQLAADPAGTAGLYRRLKEVPGLEAVQSRHDLVENITRTLLQNQYVFIGVLVAFAGVLMFGSTVNAAMVNLAERQAEVATFRALGYSEWQVGSLFFQENLLLTLAGAVLGLPTGYFLTWLLAYSYDNDLLRIPVVTAPWVWWSTLTLAVLFGVASQGVVQWTLRRLNVVEALKASE
jgi:putative ABC transport system permease protein